MPKLSAGIASTTYSKTPGGRDRAWMGDNQFPLGTRQILSGTDRGYRVVATAYGVGANAILQGEIIASVGKERGRVFFPVTLATFHRAAEHIRTSNDAAIERGENDIRFFLYCAAQLKDNWFELGEDGRSLLVIQLQLIVARLLRADTMNRLAAGTVLEHYTEIKDILKRYNPLIVRGKLAKAVDPVIAQVAIDENSTEAIDRRILMAASLWQEVEADLAKVMALTASPLGYVSTKQLLGVMEGLQLKPYSYAVSYSLWLLQQQQLDTENRIRSAFVAETMYLGIEAALSEIKHHPQQMDRITLTDFNEALPIMKFDVCYASLASTLVQQYQLMASAFADKDFEGVAKMAENLQNIIRNRGGKKYADVWRQPPIVDGKQLAAHPALPDKYQKIRQPA